MQSFASITSDCTASVQSAGKVGASSIARCSGAIADRISPVTPKSRHVDKPAQEALDGPGYPVFLISDGSHDETPGSLKQATRFASQPFREEVGERLEISSGKLGEPGVPQVVRSVGQPGILFSLLGNCPGQRSGENSEMYFEQVRRHPSIAQNRSEPGNLAADLLRFVLSSGEPTRRYRFG